MPWALPFVFVLDGSPTLGILDGSQHLVCCLRDDCSAQLVAEQHVERLGQLTRDRVVIAYQQALEEREIELPPHPSRSFAVGGLAVSDPRQGAFEIGLGCLEVGGDLGQSSLYSFECVRDSFLLALEQFERHGSGVVGVEQRLALVPELAEPSLLRPAFAVSVETELGQFFAEKGSQRRKLALGQLHGCVVRGYGLLGLIDVDGALCATRRIALASSADEVWIGAAVAFGVGHNQPTSASAAVDTALEVVRVFPLLLSGKVLGAQQLLNLPERLRRDKRLVLAGIGRAPVAHHADVVGIAQQSVEVGNCQRLAASRTLHRRQPSGSQLVQQTTDRPFAGCVCLERPGHQRPALGVDLHGSRFTSVDELTHVQVANGSPPRCAAVLGLLDGALDDLVGEVAAVELCDRGHNAVQQQAGRRLVDVLADADQFDTGLLERQVDRYVIGAVARQPIDLVDDDVLDGMLRDVGQHALQFWPVGGLGRLAALHKLLDHCRTEAGGLARAAFTLGGDGVALALAALLGLLLAGHSQVDDGGRSISSIGLLDHCHRLPLFRLNV